jgi:hypothetical protein
MIDLSINIHIFRRRFLRIFRHQTYKDVCEREWVISPASTSIAPPAIYLAGETEKITGLEPNTNNINEQFRINGGQREHAAFVMLIYLVIIYIKKPLRYKLVFIQKSCSINMD